MKLQVKLKKSSRRKKFKEDLSSNSKIFQLITYNYGAGKPKRLSWKHRKNLILLLSNLNLMAKHSKSKIVMASPLK